LARRGVDRRRLQALVAQECRHAYQVGAGVEGMLAEAVPERMRGDVLEPSQTAVLCHEQLDCPGTDPLPPLTDEEVLVRNCGPYLEIAGDRPSCIDVQRQDPEFAALA